MIELEPGMNAKMIATVRNQVEREILSLLNMLGHQTGLDIHGINCRSVENAGRTQVVAIEIDMRMPREL